MSCFLENSSILANDEIYYISFSEGGNIRAELHKQEIKILKRQISNDKKSNVININSENFTEIESIKVQKQIEISQNKENMYYNYIKAKFVPSKYGDMLISLNEDRDELDLIKLGNIKLINNSAIRSNSSINSNFNNNQANKIIPITTTLKKIEDFDIFSNSNSKKLKIIIVSLNGKCEIYEANHENFILNFTCVYSELININGCSCVCCNNYKGIKNEQFLIGCYNNKKNNENANLIKYFEYDFKHRKYQKKDIDTKMNYTITDIKIGYQIGTNFSYVCACDLGGFIHFFKFTFDYESIDNCKEITFINNLDNKKNVIYSISWNPSGTIVSGVDGMGNNFLFKLEENKEKFNFYNLKL